MGTGVMGRTHALAGVASLWCLQAFPSLLLPEQLAPLSLLTALGTLLPDLDASQSQIRNLAIAGIAPFALIASLLNRTLGHRGLLHSALGWGIATLVLIPLAFFGGITVPLALSLGYGSHLATDACTKSGIPFFYPNRRRYHLLPRTLRLTTGSMAEKAVFAFFAVTAAGLMLRQLPLML